MSLKNMTHMVICKEKYRLGYPETITKKIAQEKFREFVNKRKEVFLWKEETEAGKILFENLERSSHKESDLKHLNQFRAFAFYKKDKGYYGLDVVWNSSYGLISINFNNSRVTIPALEILLEMADYCDAMLIVNGRKQITKEFIEKEKLEIAEKKTVKKTSKTDE